MLLPRICVESCGFRGCLFFGGVVGIISQKCPPSNPGRAAQKPARGLLTKTPNAKKTKGSWGLSESIEQKRTLNPKP